MRLIAITGGIGSGKSVVSRVLMSMGEPVYDCDSRAKLLMDADKEIIDGIARVCSDAVTSDGRIDRVRLAAKVFSDTEALTRLNRIVHGAVRLDILRWSQQLDCGTAWIETAIARGSGILDMVDEVWNVVAPQDLRIHRVISRSGLTAAQVLDRIEAQQNEDLSTIKIDKPIVTIINDNTTPILPQITTLLNR